MAYISAEDTKQIRDTLKKEFPNLKFSVVKRDGMVVEVAILKGDIDFSNLLKDGQKYAEVNTYWHEKHNPEYAELFNKIIDIIKYGSNRKHYDNSDIMSDYFDTAFYYYVSVGKWNKPYEFAK